MSRVHTSRALIPRLSKDNNELEIWTTCGPDDQFSSPKQIRWSAALGKLLVADYTNKRAQIRNADLSFNTARSFSSTLSGINGIQTDDLNVYVAGISTIFKRGFDFSAVSGTGTIQLIRMIDASGDPNYCFVSSNYAADGHGIRMVEKSTMTVPAGASILATGSGDNQFTNPLGLFYVAATKKLYVAEATRICVITVDDTDGSESLTWDTSYAISGIMDLFFDGTNWFTISATKLTKWDNVFTDGTKVEASVVGYSITLIPDQSDGNGATLAITDNTNSHLARYKCSDLTLINEVGSSGDGSANSFDPVVIGPAGTWYMDDGATFPVASAADISWNGFSGYTFKSAGPHRAVFRPSAGGLAAITQIDCNNDLITSLKLTKLSKLNTLTAYTNQFYLAVRDMPQSLVSCNLTGINLVGDLRDTPRGLKLAYFASCASLTGTLADLPPTITTISLIMTNALTGSFADLPATVVTAYLHISTGFTAGSIAHLINVRDFRAYSAGLLSADVDTVLLSISDAIHADVNHFTYATPILEIGGTNEAPGGTAAAATTSPLVTPGSGNTDTDWEWDAVAGKHKALTGCAALYVMANNTGHAWTVTYTVPVVVGEGDFSFVIIPDTQNEINDPNAAMWQEMYEYIIAQKDNLNILAVVGVGDIVNTHDDSFVNALTGWNAIRDAGIPILPISGNHELDSISGRDYTTWNANFPVSFFDDDPNYGGCFESTTRNYYIVCGNYIIIGLEIYPRSTAIAWAQGIIEANPTKTIIVSTHGLLNADGTYTLDGDYTGPDSLGLIDYNNGQELFDALKGYANVQMIVSGHVYALDVVHRLDLGTNGNRIHQIMTDRQAYNHGNGEITIAIVRAAGTLDVINYSTVTDTYDDAAAYQEPI